MNYLLHVSMPKMADGVVNLLRPRVVNFVRPALVSLNRPRVVNLTGFSSESEETERERLCFFAFFISEAYSGRAYF